MEKSVSHAASTRVTNISQGAGGPRADIGRGLIQHVIRIFAGKNNTFASSKTNSTTIITYIYSAYY
jgi:hypothetical protein